MLMFCGSRSAAGCPVLPLLSCFLLSWSGGGVRVVAGRRVPRDDRVRLLSGVCVLSRVLCVVIVNLFVCVRCYERSVDALALGADEGRGGLRYSSGSRLAGCDPRVSEWGDPAPVVGRHPCLKFIGRGG